MKNNYNSKKSIKNDENSETDGKRVSDMSTTTIERYCTVSESLEESLKEMKLMREGKLPKKTWKNLFKEINKERKTDGE